MSSAKELAACKILGQNYAVFCGFYDRLQPEMYDSGASISFPLSLALL